MVDSRYSKEAGLLAGRGSHHPGVIMKPEGSLKICVLNNSRQVDKVVQGEWVTQKVLPEAGLPKGIYQLSDAQQASKNVHPQTHAGQIVHVEGDRVFQLSGKGVVQHDKKMWEKEPVVGKSYEIAYSRGVGKVKGELTQEETQKIVNSQAKSRSL